MRNMLRAYLFGSLTIEIDGRTMPEIAGLRPRSVLAWLLSNPGTHARAHVAALFWPDVLDISARASLRNALWGIRRALDTVGGAAYLESDRESVGIADGLAREVDTEEFVRLAERDDTASLREALMLAHAPLLADLADDWVLDAREEFRERAGAAAARLAELCEQDGDLRGAVSWTRRAIAHVPVRESSYRALMQRLAKLDERGEALAAFERCRAMLDAEFGTVPSESTRVLADRLRSGQGSGEGRRVAARPAEPGRQGALPGQAASRVRRSRQRPLVGRDSELTTLSRAWEGARRGNGGVVLISGAAGLGKSRLTTELIDTVSGQGPRCAVGTAFELDGAPPYAPWGDVLHQLVADVPAPSRDASWPSDLARLCRSVEWRWGRPAARSSADPEQERRWLFASVAEALAWCSGDRPLLLVLEDIHLADTASIALIASLGRRLTELPVLLVATRRPASAPAKLVIAIDTLRRQDALVTDIHLGRLSATELDTVVWSCAPELGEDARDRAVEVAEGNPLLARRAALAASDGADPSDELRDWIRAPLARLDGPARLLVDAVALLGRPMDTGEAAALVGSQQLAEALERAGHEELLEIEARRIRFVHALVRQACGAEIEPSRRAWLHGRIAEMLEERPGRPVAEIARHLLNAGDWERAQAYLITAAEKARSLGAFDEAAGLYSEAASLDAGSRTIRAELWLALADVHAWRGRKDEHDTAFAHACTVLEEVDDSAALAGAYALRGRCLRTTLCHPGEALRAYERALHIIDTEHLDAPELRAIVVAGLGWIEVASGDLERAEALLAEAEVVPEAGTDLGLAAEVCLARAAALLRRGRPRGSERESEDAAGLARRAGRQDLACTALVHAAGACAAQGQFERVLELADRVRRSRPASGMADEALAARAYALARTGRCAEAWEAALAYVRSVASTGDASQEARAEFDAASVALDTGRYGEAATRFASALAEPSGQFSRALARVRLAEALVRDGLLGAAHRELEQVPFEPAGQTQLPETLVPRLELVEGLIAAARGASDRALHCLASAEAAWRRMLGVPSAGEPGTVTFVDLARPPVGGQVEPGVELGRVLAERAVLLSDVGRADDARAAAEEAILLADRLGFDGYRQRVNALRSPVVTTE
ncbi:AAA family ATPase [Haloechinothrix sp. YIM 98757]|uniref:AAA family ATPase n=1 Tax=Haloechinothrix aidingensis TaxID=2752311 RepID=A0A838A940_9PSEU|nr:AAA family ATPase [Haloechinothrix aidingensis]MBA0125111.1 AAA family ATPase [Haloechinothrix aidingensis]